MSQASRKPKDPKLEPSADPVMPPPNWVPTQTPTAARATDSRPSSSRGPGIPVKEWETALPLPLPLHNITTLPEEDPDDPTFDGALPPLTEEEQQSVKQWIANDQTYAKSLGEHKLKTRDRIQRWAKNHDFQTPWWEMRKGEPPARPRHAVRILFPEHKREDRARKRGRREVRFSPAQLKSMANVEDQVIPVRVELEHDHWKIRDTFMWNCADTVVTPELFAASLCQDFGVPEGIFVPRIVAIIREREREFQNQVLPILPRASGSTVGKINPEGDADARGMYEVFRRAREGSVPDVEAVPEAIKDTGGSASSDEIKTEVGEDDEGIKIVNGDAEEVAEVVIRPEKPMTVEEANAAFSSVQSEDMRFLIKVGRVGVCD